MPVDQKRIIALAIAGLESEKSRIDAELAELRAQLSEKKAARPAKATTISSAKAKAAPNNKAGAKFVRTTAQKAKTANAMKALWKKIHKAGFTNMKDYQASLKKA